MKNKIAVLFGPVGGSTEKIAKLIAEKIGSDKCDIVPVKDADEKLVSEYKNIIIGGSTIGTHNWSIPNSSNDWDEFLPKFRAINFEGKNCAIFGLGDHLGYPNSFVDSMRIIYDILKDNKATIHGFCNTDDYEFNESQAIEDGKFVGLPIDEDFEDELSSDRIDKWLKSFIDKM